MRMTLAVMTMMMMSASVLARRKKFRVGQSNLTSLHARKVNYDEGFTNKEDFAGDEDFNGEAFGGENSIDDLGKEALLTIAQ